MNEVSIEIKNASVTYRNGVKSLDDVTLNLQSGRIWGLVGANGTGKSTLFKAIMGLLPLQSGSIRVLKFSSIRSALKDNSISYVPQSEDIDWNFPVLVEDVVLMGRYGFMGFFRKPKKKDWEVVEESLAKVGLLDFRKRQIGELSGGQRKRVFLARALAQNAPIILLDEPFTGVDVQTETAITEVLLEIKKTGKTILVSTHNLGSVPKLCDEVIFINRKVLAVGSVAKTFTQKNLSLAFGSALRHVQVEGPQGITVVTDDEHPVVFYPGDSDE